MQFVLGSLIKMSNKYEKEGPQMKNIISQITMKELEQIMYRSLQESFSEAMATILTEMDAFEYDPTYHQLVINGDGAKWITSCREYFHHNATFVIDRFHVARDVQRTFRDHSRYRSVRKRLATYDAEGFMIKITIKLAVGTHEDSSGKSNSRKSRRKCSVLPRNTIKENFYSQGCPRKAKCAQTAEA